MTSEIANHVLPIERLITLRMIVVIAAYAAVVFAGRRGWLKPKEVLWIGGAVIFWASIWLFEVVVQAVRARYVQETQYVGVTLGLVLPITAAMILGLWFLYRRISVGVAR